MKTEYDAVQALVDEMRARLPVSATR
jgi:hypothetical protein